jgi:hypothetical protein
MGDPANVSLSAATARGDAIARDGTLAVAARYDVAARALQLTLANGCTVSIPADRIEGLADAPDAVRADIDISGIGYGLHWPKLDLDLSVPGLLAGLFGTVAWVKSERARRGGASRSAAKVTAARTNGAKGGRPRKTPSAIGT